MLISVIDPGTPLSLFESYLDFNARYISHYKFAWASSLLLVDLDKKINALKSKGIKFYCGGSLFELAYRNNEIDNFHQFITKHGFTSVEISDGSTDISSDEIKRNIDRFSRDFEVLVEVGKKDSEVSDLMYPELWINQIQTALDVGASFVVLEGRESSSSGIFRSSGELRKGLVLEIINHCDISRLFFEIPNKKDQVQLLQVTGNKCCFGNISNKDVIKLVALIHGYRGDTLSSSFDLIWPDI